MLAGRFGIATTPDMANNPNRLRASGFGDFDRLEGLGRLDAIYMVAAMAASRAGMRDLKPTHAHDPGRPRICTLLVRRLKEDATFRSTPRPTDTPGP